MGSGERKGDASEIHPWRGKKRSRCRGGCSSTILTKSLSFSSGMTPPKKRGARKGQGKEGGGCKPSHNRRRDCTRSIQRAVQLLRKASLADPNLSFACIALPKDGCLLAATSGIFDVWKSSTSRNGMTSIVKRLASAPKEFMALKKTAIYSFKSFFQKSR